MNIDHLRYFLVLTQEMHYGRAAQRLNISQSGLSHAMAALEQVAGSEDAAKQYYEILQQYNLLDEDGNTVDSWSITMDGEAITLPNAPGGHRHPPHPDHSPAPRSPGHLPVPPVQSSAPRL